ASASSRASSRLEGHWLVKKGAKLLWQAVKQSASGQRPQWLTLGQTEAVVPLSNWLGHNLVLVTLVAKVGSRKVTGNVLARREDIRTAFNLGVVHHLWSEIKNELNAVQHKGFTETCHLVRHQERPRCNCSNKSMTTELASTSDECWIKIDIAKW